MTRQNRIVAPNMDGSRGSVRRHASAAVIRSPSTERPTTTVSMPVRICPAITSSRYVTASPAISCPKFDSSCCSWAWLCWLLPLKEEKVPKPATAVGAMIAATTP